MMSATDAASLPAVRQALSCSVAALLAHPYADFFQRANRRGGDFRQRRLAISERITATPKTRTYQGLGRLRWFPGRRCCERAGS